MFRKLLGWSGLFGVTFALLFFVAGFRPIEYERSIESDTFSRASLGLPTLVPLAQGSVTTTLPLPVTTALTYSNEESELRSLLATFLPNVSWLITKHQTTTANQTVYFTADHLARLERQLFRYMDDSSEDKRELRNDLTEGGELIDTSLLNPQITDATINSLSVSGSTTFNTPITLLSTTPTDTTAKLYNTGGSLYWAGNLLAGGLVGTWDSNGSDVYRLTGNVGIGTSTPVALLTLTNTGSGASLYIEDQVSDTTPFIIDANGLVGVGVATPSNLLDVAGTISSRVHGNLTGSRPQIQFIASRGTVDAPLAVLTGSRLGDLGWRAYDGSTTVQPTGIVSIVDGAVSAGSVPSGLYFETGSSVSNRTTRLTIGSNGNVGIGTTSPASKLDVWGDFRVGTGTIPALYVSPATGNIGLGTTSPVYNLHIQSNGPSRLTVEGPGGVSQPTGVHLIRTGLSMASIGYAGNSSIFKINNSGSFNDTHFAISATGNIGIGTSTPLSTLDINGSTTMRDFLLFPREDDATRGLIIAHQTVPSGNFSYIRAAGAVSESIQLYAGTGLDGAQGRIVLTAKELISNISTSTGFFTIRNASSTDLLTVTEAGLIGIGTSSPTRGLVHIYSNSSGTTTFAIENIVSNTSETRIHWRNAQHDVYAGIQHNSLGSVFGILKGPGDLVDFVFDTTDNTIRNQLYLTRRGNIGIGTTSPVAQLHIATTSASDILRLERTGTRTWGINLANGNLTFSDRGLTGAGSTEVLTLQNATGYVGIGTTTPGFKLHLDGDFAISTSGGQSPVRLFTTTDTGLSVKQTTNITNGNSIFSVLDENDNNRFMVTEQGSIGIGTSSPRSNIDITGSTNNVNISLEAIGSGSRRWLVGATDDTNSLGSGFFINNISDNRIALWAGQDGTVGIGTTTPFATLTIANTGTNPAFRAFEVLTGVGSVFNIDNLGNVGIDIQTPSGELHIHDPIGNTSYIRVTNMTAGTTSADGFMFRTEGVNARIVNLETGLLSFSNNGFDSALVIATTSFVGIGTSTPAEELTVVGTINSTNLLGGATNLTTDANGNIIRDPSDVRLKENITDIDNALDIVLALRGVRYEWRDPARFGNQIEIGFLAQEVDDVLPEVVSKGGEYWSLNTKNMLAVVVEAIEEMWNSITNHESRLEELEAENIELRARLNAVEQQINAEQPARNSVDSEEVTKPENESDNPESSVSEVLVESNAEGTSEEEITTSEESQPVVPDSLIE